MPSKGFLSGLVALGLLQPATGADPSYFSEIGYSALQQRLGVTTPTGSGITVAQIEALVGPNNYLPYSGAFPYQTIFDQSGGGDISEHATTVGQYYYGSLSIAQGITQVYAYKAVGDLSSGDWIGDAYLRSGTTLPPLSDPARVQNHSYISLDDPSSPATTEVLRRLDFAIRRDNFIAVVAVNNGPGSIPALQANAYNAIAVGLTNGNSSIGPSTGDGIGRAKPDIVAPADATSYATPIVATASALLLQTADGKINPTEAMHAGRVETIKAVLISLELRLRHSMDSPNRGTALTTARSSNHSTAASVPVKSTSTTVTSYSVRQSKTAEICCWTTRQGGSMPA